MKLWKITLFGLALVVLVLVWIFVIGISASHHGSFYNQNHNAVWIGHEWVGEQKSNDEIEVLVNVLKSNGIDTVFVHSGPINYYGNVDPEAYKYSIDFLDRAKRLDEEIQYQAWLGQIRSKLDLSDPEIRHNIANLSMIMTQMVGFDGIHFDIEPVWDGDEDFIELLEIVDDVLPEDKQLSVALAEFIPQSLIWFLEKVNQFENYNTEVNFLNVAKYADQIVVMVYDTGINDSWLYKWLVMEQTIRVTETVEDREVFIAIPAYDEVKKGFNPEVENLRNGLIGIVNGLNNIRSNKQSFAGVAIYPYWEIDRGEWKDYRSLWLTQEE